MDQTQHFFLSLLSDALTGSVPEIPEEFGDWENLFRISREQKLLPLIFETVCPLPQVKALPQFPQLKREVMGQVMLQTRKTAQFTGLLAELTEAGLQPLVVKGLICRQLWPMPDHRPSSDEDVLIPPEQLEACHRALTRLGLVTQSDPASGDYELPYFQPDGSLYIELHRSLFPPESEAYGSLNRFFTDVHRRAVSIRGIPTLEYTDHLIYLICHALKHFLHSGFGLRQVCDIILFARAYSDQIQWARLEECCQVIRADRFAAALFRIGEKHLGLGALPCRLAQMDVDEMPMLLDLLEGGIYGGATVSRRHSSNITLEAVRKKGGSSVMASLFPPSETLEGRYPYLKKRPWLLPAAWASRIGTYLADSSRRGSPSEALRIGSRRVELLREYDIIP